MAPTLLSQVTTDLTISDVLGYYKNFTGVALSDIQFHLLPVISGRSMNGLSVLSVKRYPTADLLNESFRPYMDPVPAEKLQVIELVKDYGYTSSKTQSSNELN